LHLQSPKTIALIAASAMVLLILAACGGGSSDSNDSPVSSQPETIHIPTRWASANAADIRSLVGTSEVVFVGTVARLVDVREETLIPATSGSPVDGKPGRGASTIPISVYEVSVDRQITGEAAVGSTVLYEQAGGLTERNGVLTHVQLAGDEPVRPGITYLFFASHKANGALAAPPYGRVEVTSEGIKPAERWAQLGALQRLAGLSVGDAAGVVERGE
jgi:hypothetical protein